MKLQVKNLGPIKKGEIDLSKRFNLFVGYNNSGKTYMSQVVWSVLDSFAWTNLGRQEQKIKIVQDFRQEPLFTLADHVLQDTINTFTKEIKQKVIENFNSNIENDSFSKFELSFPDFFDTFKKKYFKAYYYTHRHYFLVEKLEYSLVFRITKIDKNKFTSLSKEETIYKIHEDEDFNFLRHLYEFIIKSLIDKRFYAPFFLPANRSFYPNFYKYIYEVENNELEKLREAIRQNKSKVNLEKISPSTYTQSTRILIQSINNLNLSKNKENDYYKKLLNDLKTIIGGNIVLKPSNPEIASLINFKLQLQNSTDELDMHLASSSVNQLTTLDLYLKYWAWESENTLIIDEPEENLHPRNQRALLEILMKFANLDNNRVILTTHSPLMTDVVNNYLHLGYLADKYEKNSIDLIKDNELDLNPASALSQDAIGIYFFDGQGIKEYSVEEYGVDFKDFRKEQENIEETGNALRRLISKEKKTKNQVHYQKLVQSNV